VKYPYNVSLASMEKAMGLLRRDVSQEIALLNSERVRLAEALADLPRVRKVWPSDANFLLVEVDDARGLYDELLDAQVIVRDRSKVLGCEGCLRISVGTPQENDKVIAVIGGLKPESVVQKRSAKVVFPEDLLAKVAKEKRDGLCECLAEDPRPSYQDDPARIYGMRFADYEIKFKVEEGVLTVVSVLPLC
jgi:hypothetical protein